MTAFKLEARRRQLLRAVDALSSSASARILNVGASTLPGRWPDRAVRRRLAVVKRRHVICHRTAGLVQPNRHWREAMASATIDPKPSTRLRRGHDMDEQGMNEQDFKDFEAVIASITSAPAWPNDSFAPSGGFPVVPDNVAQLNVVASNLVTYPKDTPRRVRDVVDAWVLAAQKHASSKVPDPSNARAWAGAYNDFLLTTGWRRAQDLENTSDTRVVGGTVHNKILTLAAAVLGPAAPAALAMITLALKALDEMDDDSPWITLFDRRGHSTRSVGFQIANCEANDDAAALTTIDYVVEAREVMTQVLFFKFRSQSAFMEASAKVLVLPAIVLERLGDKVIDSVIGDLAANIGPVELTE